MAGITGLELLAQMLYIVVTKTLKARIREQTGVEQGRVIQTILKHGITATDQRIHRPQVRHITGGKEQRAGAPSELGELLFQQVMFLRVTADQMGGTAADAVAFSRFLKSFQDFGVVGETEIVIAAKADELATIHLDLHLLWRLHHRAHAIAVQRAALRQPLLQSLFER